jgi:transposase InsO family protein
LHLRRQGHDVARCTVERLMREMGIHGVRRGRFVVTTRADPAAARPADRVDRDFTTTAPKQLWVADFTYCSTWSGVIYVAFVMDVFSRRLVGWKASRAMTAELVVDALNMAAWQRRHTKLDNLICHTDAGSQYTSVLYTDRIGEIGAAPSIGTVADSFDCELNRTAA